MKPFISLLFRLAVVICLFTPYCASTAQTIDPDHRLLWKITGNNLPAPSYLYGTMHIQDERAFAFSDSVLLKLQECSAFAMEILPDSAVTYMFREMFSRDSTDTGNALRTYMTDEQYERLTSKLNELGLDADEINTSKPWVLKTYLGESGGNYRKDRSTFVDGYLYRLARQFRKDIFALEFVEEQLRDEFNAPLQEQIRELTFLLDDKAVERSAPLADSLLELYRTGRLDSLLELIRGEHGLDDRSMHELITRNHTMVERLLPRIQQQSVFVAVGAAHLPGYEGLIELLQRRGYTVVPVTATFTGLADEITAQPLHDPWHTVVSEDAAYSVEMPLQPVAVPMNRDGMDYTMNITSDLGTGVNYIVTHVVLPLHIPNALYRQSLDSAATAMAEKGTILEEIESIEHQGREGIRFAVQISDDFSYEIRLFIRRNIMYMFMASLDREEAGSYDVERFFSSIAFGELPQFVESSEDFTNEEGAFSIRFPSTPSLADTGDDDDDDGVRTYLYNAMDAKGAAYFAGYYSYMDGTEMHSRSLMFIGGLNAIATNMGGEVLSRTDTTWQGLPALDGLIQAETYSVRVRFILRGNRPYILMIIGEEEQQVQQAAEDFFNSMRLLPFRPAAWNPYTSDEHGFTLQVPGQVHIARDTTDGIETIYTATDGNSGENYTLSVDDFSDYREAENEDDFFEKFRGWHTHYSDSVYSTQRLTVAGYPAFELTKAGPDDSHMYKIRGILCGQRLYTLGAKARKNDPADTAAEHFLASFIPAPGIAQGTLFDDGTEELFRDLASPDSTVRRRAGAAVRQHEFSIEDRQNMYRALERTYGDDSTYFGVRTRLLTAMEDIADSTTPAFIRSIFPSLSGVPFVQNQALSLLVSMNTGESLAAFTELATGPALAEDTWLPFYDIATSTATCRVMFPGILSIIGKDDIRSSLYYFISRALDSGVIAPHDIASAHGEIFRLCRSDYERLRAPWEEDVYDYYSRVENTAILLGYIGGDSARILLNTMVADTATSLVREVALALARNNCEVHSDRWEWIAADPLQRGGLYEGLEKLGRTALFPQKYYGQEAFAEADMISTLVYNHEEPMPQHIELVEEYEVADGERAGRYFLFKYLLQYDSDTEGTWYVGISGPQPLDESRIVVSGMQTTTLYNELDAMSMDEHIAAFMNNTN